MTQQQQNPQPPNYNQGPPDQSPNQNGYGQPPYQNYQQPGQPYPPNYPTQGYNPQSSYQNQQQQPGYPPPQQPAYYAPAQPVKKGGFPVWALLLLLIPAIIVGGCLTLSFIVSSLASKAIDSASTAINDGSGTISSARGTVGPAEQVKPLQLDLATDPARTFTYAGLKITVKKGQISNQISTNPARYRADAAHLDLTLNFTNPTGRDISISSTLLQVTLADGSVYKYPFDYGVQQQDTKDQTYSFNVPPTATWGKAQLSLSQVGKEPVSISLDGAATAAAFPVNLSATGTLNLKNPDVDYILKDARIDLDANGTRAPTGKRYLILTITIASHAPNGAFIGDDNFRLTIDGTTQATDSTDIPLKTGYKDVTSDSTIIFLIPATAQTATLQLGEKSQVATIPVSLTARK